MDLLARAQQMTPEEIVTLLERSNQLETDAKSLEADTSKLKAELATAENQKQQLNSQVNELKARLEWFLRQKFGAKSERRILGVLEPADQLWLGQEMLDLPEEPPADDVTAADFEDEARGGPKRKRRKKKTDPNRSSESESSRLNFDESVPVEEIVVEDPELDALPENEVEIIDEIITYKVAQRSPYVVIKMVRRVWKRKGDDKIHRVKAPSVIERSIADVSFLAGLAVDKHCHHLPLYRQHQRLKQAGINIQRATLTNLLNRVAEMCEMIYQAQLSSILNSEVLTVDESPTPAGRANGKIKQGYYWALYGDKKEAAFVFSPTRSHKVADELLSGYQGILHSDGYRAYEAFCRDNNGVTWAGCWAHVRRKFIEAEKQHPQKVKKILHDFQILYEIEARGRGKPKQLEKLRKNESQKVVDRLFTYFRDEIAASLLVPSNRFIKAINYAINREDTLRVFLENPEVAIDTNHIEREIRYPVMGRKNWMFHWTENGARHSGILYSLLLTCQLHDINPRTYLIDILQRMDFHPAKDVYQLTPLNWKNTVKDAPLKSLIDP